MGKGSVIVNILIMIASAVAVVFLLISPVIDFEGIYGYRVNMYQGVVPTNDYVESINVEDTYGAKEYEVTLKFKVDKQEAIRFMNRDFPFIKQKAVGDNVAPIIEEAHKIVKLATTEGVKLGLKNYTKKEVAKLIGASGASSTEVMNEAGMNDTYFMNFANSLYEEAFKEGATYSSLFSVVDNQVNTSLAAVSIPYVEESRSDNNDSFTEALKTIQLLDEDNLVSFNDLHYKYFHAFLEDELQYLMPKEQYARQDGEDIYHHTDRMLTLYLIQYFHDQGTFADLAIVLFIGMFFFAAIWVAVFFIALNRIVKNPYGKIGAWFYILGAMQVIVGIGGYLVCKFYLPLNRYDHIIGLAFNYLKINIITNCFISSIMFIVMCFLGAIYALMKHQDDLNS